MMQRYHVRETYTPNNAELDRSREEAYFEADSRDIVAVAKAAMAAFEHEDLCDEYEDDDDLRYAIVEDGCIKAGGPMAFHFDNWANDGRYDWHVRPVHNLPEPDLFRQAGEMVS